MLTSRMRNNAGPVLLALALILALGSLATYTTVAIAQETEKKDTEVGTTLGVETDNFKLEMTTGEQDGEQDAAAVPSSPGSSGPWYENPVLAAVLGVGLLVVIILAVMAARSGSGRALASRS